jgi:hypothetical protein
MKTFIGILVMWISLTSPALAVVAGSTSSSGSVWIMFFVSGAVGFWIGRTSYRLAFLKVLGRDRGIMPWMGKQEISRFVGLSKLADCYAEIEKHNRSLYATIMIGALMDLGGRCHVPESEEGLMGLLAEAERRYVLHLKERQDKARDRSAV